MGDKDGHAEHEDKKHGGKGQRDHWGHEKYHKDGHHHNKAEDIITVVGLLAAGSFIGGMMVAIVCCIYQRQHQTLHQRKRVWPEDVSGTQVVVGVMVEKGQVPKALKMSNANANLECDAGSLFAVV